MGRLPDFVQWCDRHFGKRSATSELMPPQANTFSGQVNVRVSGIADLDHRQGEAFKPLALSSMHVLEDQWDAQSIAVGDQVFDLPTHGWLLPQPILSRRFALNGGSSSFKEQAPTLEIEMDEPLEITGWKTASLNPDDDKRRIVGGEWITYCPAGNTNSRRDAKAGLSVGRRAATSRSTMETRKAKAHKWRTRQKNSCWPNFAQLKTEILKRSEIQHQLVSITLVALGRFAAVGLKDAPAALLAYPMLAFIPGRFMVLQRHSDCPNRNLHHRTGLKCDCWSPVGLGAPWRSIDSPEPAYWCADKIRATVEFSGAVSSLAIALYLLKRLGIGWPTGRERNAEFVILGLGVLATFCTMWVMRNRDALVEEIESEYEKARRRALPMVGRFVGARFAAAGSSKLATRITHEVLHFSPSSLSLGVVIPCHNNSGSYTECSPRSLIKR
jgi:hypothetical protein